jgi:hypothetical protein
MQKRAGGESFVGITKRNHFHFKTAIYLLKCLCDLILITLNIHFHSLQNISL